VSPLSVDLNRISESVEYRRVSVRVRFLRIALLFACAVSLALPLTAQSTDGTINGRVLDPSNKVIGGVDILVINDATGVKYSGKTNDDGIYVVPNLPPGPYRLQVSKVGFKTLIKPDIVLNIQDALSINFTLPIGAVFEIVTVEGGASMINTTDASVSTVIDHTYVENMPLNGRSFQDLILLTPGIVTNSPQGPSALGGTGEFSVNGQRTESNYYTVDGVSANVGSAPGLGMIGYAGASGSVPGVTALGTTQALVSVDDLQEFRVNSSTYSAEYGRNPGGQFAFETKSGTNQWHGTAYDYLRNGYFDAQDWFNDYLGTPEPALRQNDFGGTFGGPVRIPGLYNGKDKTFFLVSYEGLRLTAPQAASNNIFVPDLCMRGMGACPSGRNQAASAVLPAINAFPLPSPNGVEDATNGFGQFLGSWSNPASIDSTSVRFDHAVNNKLRLFFRFSDTTSSSAARQTPSLGGTPSNNLISDYTMRTYTAGANSVFSNRLSNDFRLNYTSNNTGSSNVLDAFGRNIPVNLAQLTSLGPGSFPSFALEYGGYDSSLAQGLSSGAQRQWNLVETVNLSLGRHQFKLGVDYRRLTPSAAQASPLLGFIYLSESGVETNSALIFAEAFGPAYPLFLNFSAFAQDQWKVSSRLSVSMGLRWDVNPPPGASKGLKPYAFQGSGPSTWALAPQGTPLWQTRWFSFAPRLGVAYVLHDAPARETVVRGGAGVFFDTGQQAASLAFGGQGFGAAECCPFGPFPTGGAGIVPIIQNPPTPPYLNAIVYAPHLQLPYTLQWNASVEQALGKLQVFTLSYVGSHAARLLQENVFNGSSANPIASDFTFVENGLTSDYDALQARFQRRLSRGLTALGSYTWSHCIDYGSQNLLVGYQRGNCDFDVRHNLSAAFSYGVSSEWNNGFVNAVLRHWGVDDRLTARTAFPVTLNGNGLFQPNGQLYYAGLNLVPGQPLYLYGDNCATVLQGLGDLAPRKGCPGGRALNPQAFTNVSSGFGDAPRNLARGFDAVQMDLAVRREFPIHENLKLQFRAEAFNLFNHPNFGTINSLFGQPTFGQATGTLASSLGIVSPLYQQGGPRSMQFALKLVF
jgi:hypothetical protein